MRFTLLPALFSLPVFSSVIQRSAYKEVKTTSAGGVVYELGNVTYFANAKYAKSTITGTKNLSTDGVTPITVIVTNSSLITGAFLNSTVSSYLAGDDVFNNDFLESIYISSSAKSGSIDTSAQQYLTSLGTKNIYIDAHISYKGGKFKPALISKGVNATFPSGPYTAVTTSSTLQLLTTYRLYRDEYRDFITGAYYSGDGTGSFSALDVMDSQHWDPMIPVPSRIYSWSDKRALAGTRVAIKDLYDMKGLQTSGGSQAWIRITPIANATAPAIQRLVDLGAVLVGKFKLAQFASGANPWDWTDEHYPFNPRGDGYLTCSASSSGGGCSVAAYDWLDNAIGSDTGSSMRRPAAVSGTYGNRPSQGMITLDGAIPLSFVSDTAGVFSRDPLQWVKFAKAWYSPSLHQNSSVSGMSNLDIQDNTKYPKRILYLDEYLPLANAGAETILQNFLGNVSGIFNMSVVHSNLTRTIKNSTFFPGVKVADNWAYLQNTTGILGSYTQEHSVSGPLVRAWKKLYGRFPPIDPQWRATFQTYTAADSNVTTYNAGKVAKNAAVSWFNKNVLFETEDSCSEAMLICDIGTGGLPSYREKALNVAPNATLLAVLPVGALITCANICPNFGCADYTIPIGQVPYYSNVTLHEEYVPVTINMIVKRGCDFVLFNMIEELAKKGVLQTVKTGRTAYATTTD